MPTPTAESGYYYLVREVGDFCNDNGPWTSGGAAEDPLREVSLP
jgi:hypothetical protein